MCLSNLSSCDLVNLSSALAISVSNSLENIDDLVILAAFFTSFADNLNLIAVKKSLAKK